MTLRQYLILMSVGTLLCWLSAIATMWSIDPFEAGFAALGFFYASLWLAAVGTFSVIGFLIRRALARGDEAVFRRVKRTFGQSMLIASALVFALILLSNGLLRWWNALLLILLLIFSEVIIFTNRLYKGAPYV